MEMSQFDLHNETIKNLMVVCNNDMQWRLCHQINTFCAVNQRSTKRKEDFAKDDDRSVWQDTLIPGD